MNLEAMGKAVAEALALQGKMQSLEGQKKAVAMQIESNEKEIDRLQTLQTTTENDKAKEAALTKELDGCKADLAKRLDKLAVEGIVLPLGGSKGSRQVNL